MREIVKNLQVFFHALQTGDSAAIAACSYETLMANHECLNRLLTDTRYGHAILKHIIANNDDIIQALKPADVGLIFSSLANSRSGHPLLHDLFDQKMTDEATAYVCQHFCNLPIYSELVHTADGRQVLWCMIKQYVDPSLCDFHLKEFILTHCLDSDNLGKNILLSLMEKLPRLLALFSAEELTRIYQAYRPSRSFLIRLLTIVENSNKITKKLRVEFSKNINLDQLKEKEVHGLSLFHQLLNQDETAIVLQRFLEDTRIKISIQDFNELLGDNGMFDEFSLHACANTEKQLQVLYNIIKNNPNFDNIIGLEHLRAKKDGQTLLNKLRCGGLYGNRLLNILVEKNAKIVQEIQVTDFSFYHKDCPSPSDGLVLLSKLGGTEYLRAILIRILGERPDFIKDLTIEELRLQIPLSASKERTTQSILEQLICRHGRQNNMGELLSSLLNVHPDLAEKWTITDLRLHSDKKNKTHHNVFKNLAEFYPEALSIVFEKNAYLITELSDEDVLFVLEDLLSTSEGADLLLKIIENNPKRASLLTMDSLLKKFRNRCNYSMLRFLLMDKKNHALLKKVVENNLDIRKNIKLTHLIPGLKSHFYHERIGHLCKFFTDRACISILIFLFRKTENLYQEVTKDVLIFLLPCLADDSYPYGDTVLNVLLKKRPDLFLELDISHFRSVGTYGSPQGEYFGEREIKSVFSFLTKTQKGFFTLCKMIKLNPGLISKIEMTDFPMEFHSISLYELANNHLELFEMMTQQNKKFISQLKTEDLLDHMLDALICSPKGHHVLLNILNNNSELINDDLCRHISSQFKLINKVRISYLSILINTPSGKEIYEKIASILENDPSLANQDFSCKNMNELEFFARFDSNEERRFELITENCKHLIKSVRELTLILPFISNKKWGDLLQEIKEADCIGFKGDTHSFIEVFKYIFCYADYSILEADFHQLSVEEAKLFFHDVSIQYIFSIMPLRSIQPLFYAVTYPTQDEALFKLAIDKNKNFLFSRNLRGQALSEAINASTVLSDSDKEKRLSYLEKASEDYKKSIYEEEPIFSFENLQADNKDLKEKVGLFKLQFTIESDSIEEPLKRKKIQFWNMANALKEKMPRQEKDFEKLKKNERIIQDENALQLVSDQLLFILAACDEMGEAGIQRAEKQATFDEILISLQNCQAGVLQALEELCDLIMDVSATKKMVQAKLSLIVNRYIGLLKISPNMEVHFPIQELEYYLGIIHAAFSNSDLCALPTFSPTALQDLCYQIKYLILEHISYTIPNEIVNKLKKLTTHFTRLHIDANNLGDFSKLADQMKPYFDLPPLKQYRIEGEPLQSFCAWILEVKSDDVDLRGAISVLYSDMVIDPDAEVISSDIDSQRSLSLENECKKSIWNFFTEQNLIRDRMDYERFSGIKERIWAFLIDESHDKAQYDALLAYIFKYRNFVNLILLVMQEKVAQDPKAEERIQLDALLYQPQEAQVNLLSFMASAHTGVVEKLASMKMKRIRVNGYEQIGYIPEEKPLFPKLINEMRESLECDTLIYKHLIYKPGAEFFCDWFEQLKKEGIVPSKVGQYFAYEKNLVRQTGLAGAPSAVGLYPMLGNNNQMFLLEKDWDSFWKTAPRLAFIFIKGNLKIYFDIQADLKNCFVDEKTQSVKMSYVNACRFIYEKDPEIITDFMTFLSDMGVPPIHLNRISRALSLSSPQAPRSFSLSDFFRDSNECVMLEHDLQP